GNAFDDNRFEFMTALLLPTVVTILTGRQIRIEQRTAQLTAAVLDVIDRGPPRPQHVTALSASPARSPANSPSPAHAAQLVRDARPVGRGLAGDAYHRAPPWVVDDIEPGGSVFRISSPGGQRRTLIQLSGEVNGRAGRFEWIVDDGGVLVHQGFVAGGTINGIPNEP
ncbi:MAG: hypothetical protein ACRD0A_17050, partial [Acidimicrobiales bacterium]